VWIRPIVHARRNHHKKRPTRRNTSSDIKKFDIISILIYCPEVARKLEVGRYIVAIFNF